jgi:hypothetical protein
VETCKAKLGADYISALVAMNKTSLPRKGQGCDELFYETYERVFGVTTPYSRHQLLARRATSQDADQMGDGASRYGILELDRNSKWIRGLFHLCLEEKMC